MFRFFGLFIAMLSLGADRTSLGTLDLDAEPTSEGPTRPG